MLSKGKIKFIRSLQLQKYRQKYQKIVVEGAKIVTEALTENRVIFDDLIATEAWTEAHQHLLVNTQLTVTATTARYLRQISSFKTPQDVVAVCRMPAWHQLSSADLRDWMLYLDAVRDPGNVGTILRVADWFGIRNVCLSADTADPYNPKVIQASMGSLFRVQLSIAELADVKSLGEAEVLVTAMDGVPVFALKSLGRGIVVLGNEAHGISDKAASLADRRIAIPSDYRLGADSLNVGVAAGIVCAALRYG